LRGGLGDRDDVARRFFSAPENEGVRHALAVEGDAAWEMRLFDWDPGPPMIASGA
jgi:hypothetical protein